MNSDSTVNMQQQDSEPIDPEITRDGSNDPHHLHHTAHSDSREPQSAVSAPTDSQGNIDLSYVTETSARTDLHALQIAASLVNKKVAAAQAGSGHSGHTSAIDLDLSHSNPSMASIQQQIEEVLGIQHSGNEEVPDQVSRTSVEAAALSSVASNPHVQAAYTRILSEALSRSSNRTNRSATPQFYHETFRLPRTTLPSQGTRTLGMPVTAGEPINFLSTAAAAVEAARGLEEDDGSQGVVDDYHQQLQSQAESSDRRNGQPNNVSGDHRQDGTANLDQQQHHHHQTDETDPSFQTMNNILAVGLTSGHAHSQSVDSNGVDPMGNNGRRRHRHKWSDEETSCLIEGCRLHGVGNWKKILMDPKFQFKGRTAVDLKDRFRTSFPEEYARLYPNAKTHKSTRQQFPVEGSELRKINRKERRRFTLIEDENLLKGFMKYGAAWSKIQRDKEFNLGERRSTDLRDRFRNAFPAQYALAGFKGRGQYALLSEVANAVDSETAAYLRDHETVQSAGDTVRMVLNGNMSVDDAAATASAAAAFQQTFKQEDAGNISANEESYSTDVKTHHEDVAHDSQVRGEDEVVVQSKHVDNDQEPVQGEDEQVGHSSYPVYSGNLSPTLKAAAEAFAQSNLIVAQQQRDHHGEEEGNDEEGREEDKQVDDISRKSVHEDRDSLRDQGDVTEDGATQEEVMASIKIGSIGGEEEDGHQEGEELGDGDGSGDIVVNYNLASPGGGSREVADLRDDSKLGHEADGHSVHGSGTDGLINGDNGTNKGLKLDNNQALQGTSTLPVEMREGMINIGMKRLKPDSEQEEEVAYKQFRQ